MKLLIVEDSLPVRCFLKSVVEPFASEIDECGDGGDAISLYACEHHDLVLMDIDLCEMDGITATKKICADDPHARIVIVTNFDEIYLREEAKNAGACGYVLKENLLEVLQFFK